MDEEKAEKAQTAEETINLPRATKMLRAVIAWISQETERLAIRLQLPV
jgi:hypothetical protein